MGGIHVFGRDRWLSINVVRINLFSFICGFLPNCNPDFATRKIESDQNEVGRIMVVV